MKYTCYLNKVIKYSQKVTLGVIVISNCSSISVENSISSRLMVKVVLHITKIKHFYTKNQIGICFVLNKKIVRVNHALLVTE
jgi:hypothetical protein